jgi:hypothetical protein
VASLLVNQAAGMVSVQAQCGIEEAFVLMRARAAESRVTLDQIAQAVLDRAIDFRSGEITEPNRDDVLSAAGTLTERGEPINAVRVFGELRRVERHADVDWVRGELERLADENPARLERAWKIDDDTASDQVYRLVAMSEDDA